MRYALILGLLLAAGSSLSACQGANGADSTSAAMQAMLNPPNACGPGGSADINQCSSHR